MVIYTTNLLKYLGHIPRRELPDWRADGVGVWVAQPGRHKFRVGELARFRRRVFLDYRDGSIRIFPRNDFTIDHICKRVLTSTAWSSTTCTSTYHYHSAALLSSVAISGRFGKCRIILDIVARNFVILITGSQVSG